MEARALELLRTEQEVKAANEAAAVAMGNSTKAWEDTYDDDRGAREMKRVFFLYPDYRQWVIDKTLKGKQLIDRNPHNSK